MSSVAQCTKCGAIIPKNAKFCFECGEKIEPLSENTTVCPACGKTVVRGKFCPECGNKLVNICSACGKELPAGAKFCLECGEKLN